MNLGLETCQRARPGHGKQVWQPTPSETERFMVPIRGSKGQCYQRFDDGTRRVRARARRLRATGLQQVTEQIGRLQKSEVQNKLSGIAVRGIHGKTIFTGAVLGHVGRRMAVIEVDQLTKAFRTYKKRPGLPGRCGGCFIANMNKRWR